MREEQVGSVKDLWSSLVALVAVGAKRDSIRSICVYLIDGGFVTRVYKLHRKVSICDSVNFS